MLKHSAHRWSTPVPVSRVRRVQIEQERAAALDDARADAARRAQRQRFADWCAVVAANGRP